MFDSTIGKAYMNAVIALVGAMLLTSTILVAPTVTRGWGFGMMDGNESATSQDNSQAAIFTQNQLNCLNPLDDGWWSPIAGPVVVKVCVPPAAPSTTLEPTPKTQSATEGQNLQTSLSQTGPSTTSPSSSESTGQSQPNSKESSTTSTPLTQTGTSTPPPDVTETKDKEGNTVLSSSSKELTVTTIVSSQEEKISNMGGIATGVQRGPEIAKEIEREDYNKGLVKGVFFAFHIGQNIGEKSKQLEEFDRKHSPEQLNQSRSEYVRGEIFSKTIDKSDAYKLGLLRGFGIGSDFVSIYGFSGLPHKQQIK